MTYRVDDVVSGRMTPTRPLPAAVRPLNFGITEKLTSNDFTLRPAGTVAAAAAPVVVVAALGVLLHAAIVPAMERTATTTPNRLMPLTL